MSVNLLPVLQETSQKPDFLHQLFQGIWKGTTAQIPLKNNHVI